MMKKTALTCMGAFVYFEILGPGEHFAASLERARERFLARVHPDVIDQLVFGFERPALALAPVPKARVRRALGPADVLDRDVRHDVLHGAEHFAARAHRRRPGFVDPQARHVFERGGGGGGRDRPVSHVPVKRAARRVVSHAVRVGALSGAQVIAVPRVNRGRADDRYGAGQRRRRRLIRLMVAIVVVAVVVVVIVVMVMMMVQLQVVVHGRRVQSAQMMFAAAAAVLMMMAVMVFRRVPADLQKVSRISRMMRRRRRLPVVHMMMVLVMRRCRHVIVLDLDAHAVGQRRVVHKRV